MLAIHANPDRGDEVENEKQKDYHIDTPVKKALVQTRCGLRKKTGMQITYDNDGGFHQTTYLDGIRRREQAWDKQGNLKSVSLYKSGRLVACTTYDLLYGHIKSKMQISGKTKQTVFYRNGKPSYLLTEYPDGKTSRVSHKQLVAFERILQQNILCLNSRS